METIVKLPDSEISNTLSEVVAALKKQKLRPRLESKDWGDWIYLEGLETVIAIESHRGLTSTATIEIAEKEEDSDFVNKILSAFAHLGWVGSGEDGEYNL